VVKVCRLHLRGTSKVSYTVFGMDCTVQDPVTNFREANDVILDTVTGNVRENVTSVDAALDAFITDWMKRNSIVLALRFFFNEKNILVNSPNKL
jgi:hypothetical protein